MPNVEKAWNLFFNDPDKWVKLVIGAVISIIPVISFALTGYGMEIIRRHIRGGAPELPKWEGFGGYWVDGFKFFVIAMAYFLIPGIFFGLLFILFSGSVMMMVLTVILMIPVMIAIAFLLPPAITLVVDTGRMGAAFDFGAVWKLLTSRFSQWLIAIVVTFAIGLVGSILNIIPVLGFILVFPVAFIASVMGFHMFAQVYTGRIDNLAYAGGAPMGGFPGQNPVQPVAPPPFAPPASGQPPFNPPGFNPPVQAPASPQPPVPPQSAPVAPANPYPGENEMAAASGETNKVCSCGASNTADSQFCGSCGKPM